MSIDRPTFPMVRFVEGYDTAEVDLAVAMVMENLHLPEPRIHRRDLTGMRFTPTRLRPGYDMGAVDRWLDEVVGELERRGREKGRPTGTTVPQAPPVTAPALSTASSAAYVPPTQSQAIVEVRGGSSRWVLVLGLLVVLAVVAYVYYA